MKKRRGQATLFFILGIVLLIVFAFAFYAKSLLVTNKAQQEASQIVNDFIGENNINYYVQSCLSTVTDEAIKDYALHGGRINYTGQDPWQDYAIYQGLNISYGSLPNDCNAVSQDPPDYPVPMTKIANFEQSYAQQNCNDKRLAGYIGMSGLDPLCDLQGANSRITNNFGGNFDYYCADGVYGFFNDEHTVQYQLQEHIKTEMEQCTDFFNTYENLYHIQLLKDQVNFTVIYTKEGTTIQGHYPFLVQVRGLNVKAIHDFTYHSPLKIKQIYEYAARLLKQENTQPTFDIEKQYQDYFQGASYAVNIDKADWPCTTEDCPDDTFVQVVNITEDTNGNAAYDPDDLTFLFAIKNRLPVLDYINDGDPQYDIKVQEGDPITITPKGYDPDGGDVTYTYSGWKQTYDQITNEDCLDEPGKDLADCVSDHLPLQSTDNTWMHSQRYQDTHRDASIQTKRKDIGPHDVTITITDDTGKSDYQTVHILVYDLPLAKFAGNNQVPGLDNSYASVEDAYTLDASASHASLSFDNPLSNYLWSFKEGEVTISDVSSPSALLTLPQEGTPIDYKTALPKTSTVAIPQDGVAQQWSLVVQDTAGAKSEPATQDMHLFACLPITDTGNTNMYPYAPYSPSGYDHVCCEGQLAGDIIQSAQYATNDVSCYTDQAIGLLKTIFHQSFDEGLPDEDGETAQPGTIPSILSDPADPQYNDVWKRSVTRYCSGDRGNICSGDITNTYTDIASCDDLTADHQVLRCAGAQGTSCAPAPIGHTFEEDQGIIVNGQQADGICITKRAPSTGNGGTYNNIAGHQSCQATCDGNGGCTYATNCKCVQGTFGAACDDVHATKRDGDYCYTSCNNDCQYAGRTDCPAVAYCDQYTTTYDSSCSNERTFSTTQYRLSGDRTCGSTGCTYSTVTKLEANYCYADGAATKGDYCPAPRLYGNTCYYGTQSCTGTACNLQQTALSSVTCAEGEIATCTADGVACR